ncbi:MAG TPA: hypothetical protein VGJ66_07545 [Pyrinomonadaceae bacterium]|jgi:hypothetical protein
MKFKTWMFIPIVLSIALASNVLAQTVSSTNRWPEVPPADFSKLKPSDFSDDELDLPYYLAHFHRLANGVVAEGENRGFINIAVWRNPQDNRPYNARIMENILSLAFFYSTKRPWNQYYASPAVRMRLEAALDFWCRMQNSDGQFSEYGPQRWNLPATAFATKFMGQTLTLLRDGPAIDAKLHERVIKADRKAIRIVLTNPALLAHGKDYTNQYTNVFAGGLAYLNLYSDPEIAGLLRRRIRETTDVFQSPAGYFYEARGPDWGYNLGTHHSNLLMAWHYTKGTPLGKILVVEERKFVEWLAYNAVREPDGSGFTLNRAIETRQRRPFLDTADLSRGQVDQGQRLIASEVPLARAFAPTRMEIARDAVQRRAELERSWRRDSDSPVGEFRAFSPYAFLHRSHVKWYPTEPQRAAAFRLLPYLRPRFIHQRVDSRERLAFTFVRQPGYYAAFNSGPKLTSQQRYGIGLIWEPEMGSVLQSQTGTTNAAWGTILGQNQNVFEADTLNAEFSVNGKAVSLVPGHRDLPQGTLTVKYSFSDQGEKILTFGERELTVVIDHSAPFREQIPLLVGSNDKLSVGSGELTLVRGRKVLSIKFDPQAQFETIETGLKVGPRRVVTLSLQSRNSLTYRLAFSRVG